MALRPPSTPKSLTPGSTATGSQLSSRRKSSAASGLPTPLGHEELDSLRQAVKRNDPGRYAISPNGNEELASPTLGTWSAHLPPRTLGTGKSDGRSPFKQSVESSQNLSKSTSMSASHRRTPIQNGTSLYRSQTPVGLHSSVSGRSAALFRDETDSRDQPSIGDDVEIVVGGVPMEGVLRFIGAVEGKDGTWGGVELGSQWAGNGKNDGSVQGVQYFACPPACGLFLPLVKVALKIKAPPSRTPNATITSGSRASKYIGVNARQLTNRKNADAAQDGISTDSPSLSASTRRAGTNAQVSNPSLMSSSSTPRATRPRQSIGATSGSVFGSSTPRKSLGGSTSVGTPRASLSASTRRPASSLRNHPEVPPLPNGFGRPMTPAAAEGRATPSTPGTSRRLSVGTISTLSQSSNHSGTANGGRSMSRQSLASSVSRQSHRSTYLDDDSGTLRKVLLESKERENQLQSLLDGSEKLGREVEDKLAEAQQQIRQMTDRIISLERTETDKALGKQKEEGAMADNAKLIETLQQTVDEINVKYDRARTDSESLLTKWETRLSTKDEELKAFQAASASSAKMAEEERLELVNQLDKLRTAGQSLCATYEERIADIEMGRLEACEVAETLHLELDQLKSGRGDPAQATRNNPPLMSAADVINAENAQAEVEHLRAKVSNLEELLEERKAHFDMETEDMRKRSAKSNEVELFLKSEINNLHKQLDQTSANESKLSGRLKEIEGALAESQTALENERSELEGLRHEAQATNEPSQGEELKRMQKQMSNLREEHRVTLREMGALRGNVEASQHTEPSKGSSAKLSLSPRQVSVPIFDQGRRGSTASNSSSIGRSSTGGKDELTAMREQIVGLKVIVASLTEENCKLTAARKHSSESHQLGKDESRINMPISHFTSDADSLASLSQNTANGKSYENLSRQVDELKAKQLEMEKRHERVVNTLNKEVNELESLVESKIYREEELEAQIEKYKKLAKQPMARFDSPSPTHHRSASIPKARPFLEETTECEMCGKAGHEVETCPIFEGSGISVHQPRVGEAAKPTGAASGLAFCDDCEEYGHSLEHCPLADEIF